MGFAENLNKLCARAQGKAEMVVRRAALELQSGMIERTPVDTGRAKGSWQVGIGMVNTATTTRTDTTPLGEKDDAGAALAAEVVLNTWKPGQKIFLTLSLPYARVLEYGRANGKPGSLQAPNGMVRITVQNYSEALKRAVEQIRQSP